MNRGAWQATVHGVTKDRTQLSNFCFHRNTADFCILIFYLTTLLNSLMSPSDFLLISLAPPLFK